LFGYDVMCTIGAKRLNGSWFLIKTRDPVPFMRWDDEIKLFDFEVDRFKKLIIQNPDPNEDGYYGGINEKGLAFVATYVGVFQNQISYIRRPYVRLILDAPNAKEAVEIIKSFNPRIGGNMFVADSKNCFEIEGAPNEYFIRTVEEPTAKTNHFLNLPYENLSFKTQPNFREWSHDRLERASELIKTAENLEDLKSILRDRKNTESKTAICRLRAEEECFTHSAFIFDTQSCKAHYVQGNPLENEFKEFGF
jgi:predicted choloylglycine hydrolase